ncbi:hypothetical protein SVI_4052 [Shewanella violacea DSS12]|uniref:Uncharacterized protein n=1 Tax=Shewanella violacea (strain JCM 10179 / CIP 106290 / LMG 19151 / DSS12) TaxID=637905 RepID=D4ZDW2_SHEVD|nr:hypothetical protein SVI_4052 [Shewanella violacea DSS12]
MLYLRLWLAPAWARIKSAKFRFSPHTGKTLLLGSENEGVMNIPPV